SEFETLARGAVPHDRRCEAVAGRVDDGERRVASRASLDGELGRSAADLAEARDEHGVVVAVSNEDLTRSVRADEPEVRRVRGVARRECGDVVGDLDLAAGGERARADVRGQ